MVIGDPGKWTARFRSIDNRLLERIVDVWPRCVAILPDHPEEDEITINLVALLMIDEKVRRFVYLIDYQFHPLGFTADGFAFSKGRIDMAVLLGQDLQVYLAYECKKLNVQYDGAKKSLATDYVAKGLVRFITEQYAEQLPIGCMLGYVMDGDCASAIASVQAAILASADAKAEGPAQALTAIQGVKRFVTMHSKATNTGNIEIRHAFLAFDR